MSNYTKLVDYAAKDLLLHGDPAKAVKGTEVGAEFDAIVTMSATKADTNGDAGEVFAVSTLELGHATDTTFSRVSAGVAAIEGLNILTGTASQVIEITRDMTLASGNVAYTGVGFTPKGLVAIGFVDGNSATSFGMSTGTTEYEATKFGGAATVQNAANTLVYVAKDAAGSDNQSATVVSLDADGFTLAWVKGGGATAGTIRAIILALK